MILSNISKAKTAQKNMLLYSRISVNVSGWKTEIKSSWQKRLVVWVHEYTKLKTNNSPIFFLQKFISLPFSLTFHFFQEYEIMYTLQIFLNEVETVIASHRTYWNLFTDLHSNLIRCTHLLASCITVVTPTGHGTKFYCDRMSLLSFLGLWSLWISNSMRLRNAQ